ncbi:unnamed protein product, partial [Pocillopora meandrina]
IHSLGVQYLLQNPEQFIESNTDHSWQDYLSIMSCQGTWADAIIIQAVANCLNLSIHIAESFETFAPVTVVQAVNVTGEYTNIYIGHISETHYVSTVEKRKRRNPDHIKEIAKKSSRRQKVENSEQVREIDRNSFRKRKEKNPEHRKEVDKQSFRKRKAKNPEHIKEADTQSFRKRKAKNPEHRKEVDKQSFRIQKAKNPEDGKEGKNESSGISLINLFHENIKCGPEYICTCCDQLWYKSSVLPNFSKANKMSFPKKPDLLNLTPLEERLISPRSRIPSGVTDTLLQEPDVVENVDRIISFAPGE